MLSFVFSDAFGNFVRFSGASIRLVPAGADCLAAAGAWAADAGGFAATGAGPSELGPAHAVTAMAASKSSPSEPNMCLANLGFIFTSPWWRKLDCRQGLATHRPC